MKDLYRSDEDSSIKSLHGVHIESKNKARYSIRNSWSIFLPAEKRNIVIYIVGIMLYKFGIEAFNGSIITLATSRYDREAKLSGTPARTFERVGLLTGLNQASQCIGSMLVTPMIKTNSTKTVISGAVLAFGILTALLLIVDAATGGTVKPSGWDTTHTASNFDYFGTYNTDVIIPFYCLTGLAYGMVETIRRVMPKDIVGGDIQKLLRMDSIVHIFYEISGTGGALCTSLVLIPALGNNMSFLVTPILLATASFTWKFIIPPSRNQGLEPLEPVSLHNMDRRKWFFKTLFEGVMKGVVLFFKSLALGVRIIFSSRRYIWLIPGYSLALYGHRFVENNIATVVAQRYLDNAAWSQILVAGSNFGELLGAFFVFIFTNLAHTPLPWLRLDSLLLPVLWWLVSWYPPRNKVSAAWVVAGSLVPVSFGWAAGDVSLVAYVQSQLEREEGKGGDADISPLSAVMSVLYSTYIVIYAVLSPVLGTYIDNVFAQTGDVHMAMKYIAGVQFTVIAGVIFFSTFVPRGAFAFNPRKLDGDKKDDEGQESGEVKEATDSSPSEQVDVGNVCKTT